MPADGLNYKRRLVLVDAGLTVAEIAAVVGPLAVLTPLDGEQATLLLRALPAIATCALALWLLAVVIWLLPIHRAVIARRRGEILDRPVAEAAYGAMVRAPRRALFLRAGLWTAGTLGVGFLLRARAGLADSDLGAMVSVAALGSFSIGVARAHLTARTLWSVRPGLLPGVTPLRLEADRYRARLVDVALGLGAIALFVVFVFAALFLPLPAGVYRGVIAWLFPAASVSSLGWYMALARLCAPIERYLDAAARGKGTDRPRLDDPRAAAAYRAAQALPWRLAMAKVASWLLTTVVLLFVSRLVLGIPLDDALVLAGAAVLIALGAAIYEAIWHRASLQGLLSLITTSHRLRVPELRIRGGLGGKMLLAFGGLVAFACGLSLLWGFVQYKSLAQNFILDEARLRLDWVRAEATARELRAGSGARSPQALAAIVREVVRDAAESSGGDAALYYLPSEEAAPDEPAGAVEGFAGGDDQAPELPARAAAAIRDGASGPIDVESLRLLGRAASIELAGRDLGRVAALYPSYRGRGESLRRPLRDLLLFFLALSGVSAGIVWLLVRDVVAPIRTLGERAAELAKGELGRAMYTGGDADEIGRLAFSLEEMRRSLRERLRSTEELTIDLEHEVERRTADLARKNRELLDALDQLRRAQAELVRAEKMAGIGQLVAGIAHEINNPVNAIVNTAAPLEGVLEDLVTRARAAAAGGGGADAATAIDGLAAEASDMLRVIQRGGKRTKDIVQALHNYSRADDDRTQDVDLHRGLDDSLDLLRHRLKSGIAVEKEYGAIGRVRGHAGQLHQVFMNILTNAAQALEKTEGGRIRISTGLEQGWVVVRIADNGPGIPSDVLGRIFDPFFTTKDVGEGSGLGLSIVHGIVERHGGKIEVESELGAGTTFIVTLPQGAGAEASAPAAGA